MNKLEIWNVIEDIETKYGGDFLNAKKWAIGTELSVAVLTVGYASFIKNRLLADIGYVGGILVLLTILSLAVLELLMNPYTSSAK